MTALMPSRDVRLERSRRATVLVFGSAGVLIGTAGSRMPSLKADLHLTDGDLGWAAAVVGATAVVTMRVAPILTRRFGSSKVVYAAAVALPLALAGIGLVTSLGQLMLVQVAFGAAQGVFDVAANSHAVALERRTARPMMNRCHAAWSVGSLVGSLVGVGIAGTVPRWAHLVAVVTILVGAVGVACRVLRSDHADPEALASPPTAARGRAIPWRPRLVVLGLIGAVAMTAEAGVVNWSAILLHDHLSASLRVAALAGFFFTGVQASGRLVGDRLLARHSRVGLVRAGTATAALATLIIVTSPSATLALVGYAALGLGSAATLPMLFALAGHLEPDPAASATAVARFGMLTYAGLLVSPAVIGWSADHIGLSQTLSLLVPAFLLAAVCVGLGAPRTDAPQAGAVSAGDRRAPGARDHRPLAERERACPPYRASTSKRCRSAPTSGASTPQARN